MPTVLEALAWGLVVLAGCGVFLAACAVSFSGRNQTAQCFHPRADTIITDYGVVIYSCPDCLFTDISE